MSMDARISIAKPHELARPGGHYSHAVRFGDLVLTSGQLGVRPDGTHTADLPFEDQARQAIGNMLAALRAAGAEPSDILKVTAYIVGVDHWPRFNAMYAEMMGDARPARTVVPVPELHYGYLVEVDAVAVCRGPGDRSTALPGSF
jgi:2-iminobutanoate/2-iminopropanoate deaminase